MKHLIRRAVWALALLTPLVGAQTLPPPTDDFDDIYRQAGDAMWWGDFDALERMDALYRQPQRRLTKDGRSTQRAFHAGLANSVRSTILARDAFFQQVDDLTLQWAKDRPDSPLAHVLHADALLRHGYAHRGNEYANKVPPEAMKAFQSHVGRAIKYLLDHRAVAMQHRAGHVTLLEAGKLAGWGIPQLWSVARQGLAAHPGDEPLMRTMVAAVVPKWGGDRFVLDRTIKELAAMAGAADADVHYARLYAHAAQVQFGHALFQESGVDWDRMKRGYAQIVERYPLAINLNDFAYHACMARDKPTLQALLEQVGPVPQVDRWGTNGLRTFEGCQRWASEV